MRRIRSRYLLGSIARELLAEIVRLTASGMDVLTQQQQQRSSDAGQCQPHSDT